MDISKENHRPRQFPSLHERHDKGSRLRSRDEQSSLSFSAVRNPLRPLGSSANSETGMSEVWFERTEKKKPPVRRALLRYGEKYETLFGISGNEDRISPSYKEDCRTLAESEDDQPAVWHRILSYASQNEILSLPELVRLHRRATTRLRPSFECINEEEIDNLLHIWISYTKVHLLNGSEKEARLTMQHIRQWASGKAAFYIQLAKMDEAMDLPKAMAILREGIEAKAQPILDLQQYLVKLQVKSRPTSATKRKLDDQQLSPKRRKTETGKVDVLPLSVSERPKVESPIIQGRKESIRFKLDPLPRRSNGGQVSTDHSGNGVVGATPGHEHKTPVAITQHSMDVQDTLPRLKTPVDAKGSGTIEGMSAGKSAGENRTATPSVAVEDTKSTRKKSSGSSSIRRQPLLSSRLGKARRNNDASGSDGSHEEDSDSGIHVQGDTEDQSKVVVPKLDLSYILEWSPGSRFNNGEIRKSSEAKASPLLPKIEESKEVSDPKKASIVQEPHAREQNHKDTPQRQQGVSVPPTVAPPISETRLSASSTRSYRERYNEDFLPLLEEKNIVRVNGVPYVKLGGPIGKGGSCKVYRGLAKDNSVVAIKKVKIGGMDKRAVESYANEIKLLKSLRGYSSIIQMFDSEVDYQRKAIFVVMELGEVDLNHALQKQSLSSNADGRRCLNMNFIRLTWQQMLSAVHCIHEARIIHGDLKPANFLFVKGTLKLIDFGIAKAIENQDTTNIYRESQIGTLNYMSPEAIQDSGMEGDKPKMKIGRASDIWSLGCILYQMVYGKTPFADLHMIQKFQAIINPNFQIAFPETVDALAIDVMQKCLQRRPDLRPPIVGKNGLLNEHPFLVPRTATKQVSRGD